MAATDSVFASKESGVTGAAADPEKADHSELLQSEGLKHDLVTMERVVNLNSYQGKQASYRGFDVIPGNQGKNKQKEKSFILFNPFHL